MKRGILFTAIPALIAGTMAVSCRRPTDQRRIATVDSLITAMDAVRLTLSELDMERYSRADSILRSTRELFLQRFADTLDRPVAGVLGDQFVQLGEAARRGDDHARVLDAATKSIERLNTLKQDLAAGAFREEELAHVLQDENRAARAIEHGVLQVITNYQANQRILDRQHLVDSLLVTTPPKRLRR